MAAVTLSLVGQIARASGRRRPAAGRGRSSRCSSCSRTGRTRSSSRGMARPSTRRSRPLTRARPPPRSSMPAGDDLEGQAAPLADVQPEQRRDRRRRPACRCCAASGTCSCGRSASSRASTPLRSRFGTSIPVADRVQALQRQVVGVVAALAGLLRPADRARRAGCRAPSAAARRASAAASPPRRSAGRAPWGSCAGRPRGRATGAAGRRSRSCSARARNAAIGAWVR